MNVHRAIGVYMRLHLALSGITRWFILPPFFTLYTNHTFSKPVTVCTPVADNDLPGKTFLLFTLFHPPVLILAVETAI